MVTGRKLLLADDSLTIQKVVELTFKDEGLEVITVSDGQLALEKLEEFTPDIVLADVFMPRLNGYEVCEYIKRNERFSHIPVMLLVGSFEPFDEAEARRVGADDYLTKPFQSIRTLIGKVSNLLTGGSSEAEEAVTRKLAPPIEAEKENRSGADFLERSTADTAPLPDFHEERESSITSREVSFADIGMDDQLIETTPARDYTSAEQSNQTRPTAQYSAADLRDAGISQSAESAAMAAPAEETVGAFASGQVSEPSPVASQSQTATRASGAASSDDSLLDLGEMEPPPQAMAEADDFFLDLLDETPQPPHVSAPLRTETSAASFETSQAAPSQPEEIDTSAPFNQEETSEAQPQAQEFAEAQIVEEARAEYEPSQETPSRSQQGFTAPIQSAPTERLPDDYKLEEAASISTPVDAAPEAAESATPRTGQITLEQLSPEVIDAIARRAVEQLSERVVEQIAWEVVPDLAELLIKRRLENSGQ